MKKTTLNGTIFNCNSIHRIKRNTLEVFFRYNTNKTPFINLKRQKRTSGFDGIFFRARQCLSNKTKRVKEKPTQFRPHGNWWSFRLLKSSDLKRRNYRLGAIRWRQHRFSFWSFRSQWNLCQQPFFRLQQTFNSIWRFPDEDKSDICSWLDVTLLPLMLTN